MKQNLTEIVFILDRSGSMSSLVSDTIGGFNSFIEQQKKEQGEAKITTVLFDDQYEVLHNCVDIHEIKELTEREYSARGMTAMLDAIGKTINDVGDRLSKTKESERPKKVIFVITTDGLENSSREFSKPRIKEMIEHQRNKYNWNFLFLGANIDSIAEAGSLGIDINYASNYSATAIGTQSLYGAVSKATSSLRSSTGNEVTLDWADEVK
jgi:uncharacterized protein YegL